MLYADVYWDLNVADANGTTVTPTILNTGTINRGSEGWSVSATPATGLTVGPSYQSLSDSVTVNSVVYPPSHASRSMVLDMGINFIKANFSLPAQRKITFSGMIQTFATSAGLSNLVDFGGVFGLSTGQFTMMQLRPSGGPFGFNIETNPGGGTQHTASYTGTTPGTWYWYSFLMDYQTGATKLALYTLDGTLVFSVTGTQTTGEDPMDWRMGNGEIGIQAGVVTNFQHLLITYSDVWPQAPMGPILLSPIRRGNRLRRRFVAQQD